MNEDLQHALNAHTPGFSMMLPVAGDPPIENVFRCREYVQSRLRDGERIIRLDCTIQPPAGYDGYWPAYWLIPSSYLDGAPLDERCSEVTKQVDRPA